MTKDNRLPPIDIILANLPRLQVGVSACLVGQPVRYDGGSKRQDYLCNELAKIVTLLPICPEFEAGLGVPRPPVKLVELNEGIHALGVENDQLDVTQYLHSFSLQRCEGFAGMSGFIFKARSPSCGVGSTPIMTADGGQYFGDGVFVNHLRKRWPLMPIVEEEQLETSQQRFDFINRIAAYAQVLKKV